MCACEMYFACSRRVVVVDVMVGEVLVDVRFFVRKDSIMSSLPSVRGPFHPCHFGGFKFAGRLCIILLPRRCGGFCRVQVLKIFRRVCLSLIWS